MQLIGLNYFAGDLAGADCGVLSIPARSAEFRDNVAVTMGIGEALGVPAFNALYGNRVSDLRPEQQDDLATENLALAAKAAAAIGGTVLVEPVSGPKPYPLRTARDVVAVLDRVPAPNIGFLCDLFHLANNGDDIDAALAAYGHRELPMCKWPTTPAAANPAPARSTLIAISAPSRPVATPAMSASSTSPTTTTIDSLRWLRQQKVTRL